MEDHYVKCQIEIDLACAKTIQMTSNSFDVHPRDLTVLSRKSLSNLSIYQVWIDWTPHVVLHIL